MPEFTTNWTDGYAVRWLALLGHLPNTPCQIIEIGNWEGKTTLWMLDNICQHSSSRLTAIDPHQDAGRYRRFLSNVSESDDCGKLNIVRSRSADYLGTLQPNSIDAVYIDGSHEGIDVLTDAVLCWRLIKPGGVIIFDDYEWQVAGGRVFPPKPAIDAFLSLVAPWSTVLHKGYQVALRKD